RLPRWRSQRRGPARYRHHLAATARRARLGTGLGSLVGHARLARRLVGRAGNPGLALSERRGAPALILRVNYFIVLYQTIDKCPAAGHCCTRAALLDNRRRAPLADCGRERYPA